MLIALLAHPDALPHAHGGLPTPLLAAVALVAIVFGILVLGGRMRRAHISPVKKDPT
ncbi:MAG: hypothetical protein JKY37_09390 [Nannocystaceae bacterium]|nr:hypothetical protein [Nannocystaceae bacterium]